MRFRAGRPGNPVRRDWGGDKTAAARSSAACVGSLHGFGQVAAMNGRGRCEWRQV